MLSQHQKLNPSDNTEVTHIALHQLDEATVKAEKYPLVLHDIQFFYQRYKQPEPVFAHRSHRDQFYNTAVNADPAQLERGDLQF